MITNNHNLIQEYLESRPLGKTAEECAKNVHDGLKKIKKILDSIENQNENNRNPL